MRQISSRTTRWNKRGFPVVLTLVFVPPAAWAASGALTGRPPEAAILIPGIAAVFGIVMMLYLSSPILHEVWIDGDDLILRNRGEEDRFPMTHVVAVEGSVMSNLDRVCLTLSPPSRFGKTIWFSPPFRILRLGLHPVAKELADRCGCQSPASPLF
jgi:hypothetical protein